MVTSPQYNHGTSYKTDPTLSPLLFPSPPQICYRKNSSLTKHLLQAATLSSTLQIHTHIHFTPTHPKHPTLHIMSIPTPTLPYTHTPKILTTTNPQTHITYKLPQNITCLDPHTVYCIKRKQCGNTQPCTSCLHPHPDCHTCTRTPKNTHHH